MIMNHGTDFGNVQSACCYIRCDQHVCAAVAKLIECAFTLILLHAAMIGLCGKTLFA